MLCRCAAHSAGCAGVTGTMLVGGLQQGSVLHVQHRQLILQAHQHRLHTRPTALLVVAGTARALSCPHGIIAAGMMS